MIYAIGDVHGSLHMLQELLGLIKQDAKNSGIIRPRLVLLGDLIDRGPHSKGVIDLLLSSTFNRDFEATTLLGNHEDTLLKILDGDIDLLSRWLHWGGAETIESYGVEFGPHSIDKVFNDFRKALPSAHIDFLKKLPLTFRHEHWLFVHAGIRPFVPLADQERDDLLWIFQEFLEHKEDFGIGAVIVHGHSVTESREVEIFSNRIAVDTGAGFRNGKLSAVRLENGAAIKSITSN